MREGLEPNRSAVGGSAFWRYNLLLCATALSFLAWLILRKSSGADASAFAFLPSLNAGFNSLAASLLVYGYWCIRRGLEVRHRYSMIAAFAASVCFLIGYVVYHYFHGDTKYAGPEAWRMSYYLLLASHVLLSIIVLPMILASIFFALTGQRQRHRRMARFTFPVWLYVSVTGVLIYLVLHVLL